MLHAHIKALLHHGVLQVAVGPGTHLLVGSVLVNVRLQSLEFEPLLLAVENCHVVFKHFRPRLLERAWPCQSRCSHLILRFRRIVNIVVQALPVLSGAWHVELQALSVEHLVVVESGRRLVESDVLSGEHFVVRGPSLAGPLGPRVLEIVLDFVSCCTEVLGAL